MDHYFAKTKQPGLRRALTKIKEELMLMGFCSVVLIAFEDNILDMCVDMSSVGGIPAAVRWKCPCAHSAMQAQYPGWGENHIKVCDKCHWGGKSYTMTPLNITQLPLNVLKECRPFLGDCDPNKLPYNEGLCAKSVAGYSTASSAASSAASSTASSTASSGTKASSRRMLLEALDSGDLSRTKIRNLAMASIDTCPIGQFPFIEQAALHQTHVIIFIMAMVHIIIGCMVMLIAGVKVKRWANWERYGDSVDEKASKLLVPEDRVGHLAILCGCKEQFTQSVDPATYIAIRRFFISKHPTKKITPENYPFHEKVAAHLNEKFAELLGIRWWMWISLGIQIILEGYGFGYLSLFTLAALNVMLIAGAKLQMVNDHLTRKVYEAYDCLTPPHGAGRDCISDENLHAMQVSREELPAVMDLEPNFWLDDPTILETMIVFALWQNSVSVALMMYFGDFEVRSGFHTCYWESRSISGASLDLGIVLFTICISAFNVVPVYVLISLSADHNEKMQKKIARKKSVHGHGHGEHGGHGGHGSEHGNGHKESHKIDEKTKIVPSGHGHSKANENLSSWGREE
jgi:hypothetical protein